MKLGIQLWPQYTGWVSVMEAAARVDAVRFDSPWTCDNPYRIVGSHEGLPGAVRYCRSCP